MFEAATISLAAVQTILLLFLYRQFNRAYFHRVEPGPLTDAQALLMKKIEQSLGELRDPG